MFKESDISTTGKSKPESRGGYENSGLALEYEYFGPMNKLAYAKLIDEYMHPDIYKLAPEGAYTPEQVEQIMERRSKMRLDYSDSFADSCYINYKDAMSMVEKSQLGDPEKPGTFFVAALRKKIADLYGSEYKVLFYTALGSHLDTKHKIDGFFKLYNRTGEEVSSCTLDITSRIKDNHTADLVINICNDDRDIYDFDSENFNKDSFFQRIDSEALIIKEKFEQNINKGALAKQAYPKRPKRPRIVR